MLDDTGSGPTDEKPNDQQTHTVSPVDKPADETMEATARALSPELLKVHLDFYNLTGLDKQVIANAVKQRLSEKLMLVHVLEAADAGVQFLSGLVNASGHSNSNSTTGKVDRDLFYTFGQVTSVRLGFGVSA